MAPRSCGTFSTFNAKVRAATIDLSRTYTNDFVSPR